MKVPETIEWLIWRPVISKIATLQEIETFYNLCDLLDASDALDLQDEAERKSHAKK